MKFVKVESKQKCCHVDCFSADTAHPWQVRLLYHLILTSPSTLIDHTRTRPVYIAISRSAKLDNIECLATRATIATVWHAKVRNRPIRITLHPGILSLRIIANGAVMTGTLARAVARASHAQMPFRWVQTTADQAACLTCRSALGSVHPACMPTAWSVSSFRKNVLLANALFRGWTCRSQTLASTTRNTRFFIPHVS